MEKDIVVEVLDLSLLTKEDSFVMIHIAVGKMPPHRIHSYIKGIHKSLPLCQQLEEKGIKYVVVARRENNKSAASLTVEYAENGIDPVTSFDLAMEDIK